MRFDAVEFLRALYAPASKCAAVTVVDVGTDQRSERDSTDTASPRYTDAEHKLLAGAPGALRAAVNAIKATSADTGGADLIDVRPDLIRHRQEATRPRA